MTTRHRVFNKETGESSFLHSHSPHERATTIWCTRSCPICLLLNGGAYTFVELQITTFSVMHTRYRRKCIVPGMTSTEMVTFVSTVVVAPSPSFTYTNLRRPEHHAQTYTSYYLHLRHENI